MYKGIPQPDCGHKSNLWQNAVQDSQALCPFFLRLCLMREKAILKGPIDRTMLIVSVLFCPHLYYIAVLWPCKPFPWCNVPSGPSILKADGCNRAYLEMDL